MPAFSPPAVDADLPGLLRRLCLAFEAGDHATLQSAPALVGPMRLLAAPTLVGALCLGGASFAVSLVASLRGDLNQDECTGIVLDAFSQLTEPPAAATPEHERLVAQWLIDTFDLPLSADDLLDVVRAQFLIELGPLTELPQAVRGAMEHQQWALALRGIERVRRSLGDATPRGTHGLAAMCLHRLGRYADADRWVLDGLGDKARLISIPAVHTELELHRRWAGQDCPVVSIICTTYNHERYIDSAIRGFLSQVCAFPFEILIHDDASTDRTQDVIRHWQERYPGIIKPVLQTVNQKSQGVRPFELLLARAQGEFVATCEGDDYWIDPGKLQRQVGFLQSHPDFSCATHNYYHFVEGTLTIKPWRPVQRDFFITPRQLMATHFLLWLPTLVFRRTFSSLPPERALAAFGDQFLTSFLGTLGRCVYFETLLGAVRRENEFSTWSPLPAVEKERRRVKTWVAMVRLHERLGNQQAVDDLTAKIDSSSLDPRVKASIFDDAAHFQPTTLAAA